MSLFLFFYRIVICTVLAYRSRLGAGKRPCAERKKGGRRRVRARPAIAGRTWFALARQTGRAPPPSRIVICKAQVEKPLQPHEQPDAKIATGPQKLTWAGIKVSLVELTSCEFPGKLARPELKTIKLFPPL